MEAPIVGNVLKEIVQAVPTGGKIAIGLTLLAAATIWKIMDSNYEISFSFKPAVQN